MVKRKSKIKEVFIRSFLFFVFFFSLLNSYTQSRYICAVYITGIGCPNCACTDPILLYLFPLKYPNLIIVEYEIYHLKSKNRNPAKKYFRTYLSGTTPGVPFLVFNKKQKAFGRIEVLQSEKIIKNLKFNGYPLPNGKTIDFEKLKITKLPGRVKIWCKDRILISLSRRGDNKILKELLTTQDISSFLKKNKFKKISPQPVEISGGIINFKNAIKIKGWIFQWGKEFPKSVWSTEKSSK